MVCTKKLLKLRLYIVAVIKQAGGTFLKMVQTVVGNV